MDAEGKLFAAGDKVRILGNVPLHNDIRVRVLQQERVVGRIREIVPNMPCPIWVEWERIAEVFRADELELVEVTPDPRDAELAHLRAENEALATALKPFAEFWNEWRELAVSGETDDSFDIWLAWTRQRQMIQAHRAAAAALAQHGTDAEAGL